MGAGNFAGRVTARRPVRVDRTTDDGGHDLFVVYDPGGVAEVSSDIRGLSPMARMLWAEQLGLAPDLIRKAGEADDMLFRGTHS
jgi:hypothetical protein